ncbi:aldo/keto reductase [Desulfotruncus alcoholivorax]|uniref:aldo/keto reductase n=1 Tax=Desulfotruncus alcoholivorax TaxID=265477 RepID=UPI000420B927|nr:aldo/keto reductase [Desulfotruncus alcoholivorax]
MKYRILGKTGLKVSVIGFGGIPIQRVSEQAAVQIVERALDLGINFFDTARGYTDSEAKLGSVLKGRRTEAIIATKSMARTKEAMAADIKKSLAELGVDYIDLYQLHNVKDENALNQALAPDGALAALQEAKKEGLIRHIGITGHIKDFLVKALKTSDLLETVQFPFNAVEDAESRELLEMARKVNAGVIAMKPLAGGALKNAGPALRFILEHPAAIAIPGMDTVEQVESNARIGDNPEPLTGLERELLNKEVVGLGTAFCRRCEYCQPCPEGVEIPMVFLLDGYFTRYNLQNWARQRYGELKVKASSCVECGQCEEKCPYELPIRKMLAEAAARLDKQ